MDFSVRKIDVLDLELWRRNNRKKKSASTQNNEFDSIESFDLISLGNKESNKQNLQITAELISLAQNNKRNNFEEAYGEYLTQKWNNSQDISNNEALELLKVFFNLAYKSLANTLRGFGNRISNVFNEDLLLHISSRISNIGIFCNSICEAIVNPAENRVMCPQIS